ncbi:LysR family transcriptional regulator [Achromobacter sp.]|uniref:LysR family transcriptional regulator n=1 Tax=Achromobacter sp. TaxID=134375 RepID=UPI0028A71BB0|nr:LysR family transcriptional regulator [Achromobacter sp.]
MSGDFDPALLRTFVAVCRLGSLSRAADQAGRAQSALSTQIRRLEEMVGKRLLHRTGRGMAPTTEGELLLSYANRILALGEAAAARLRERAVAGSVRIGLSEDVAVAALPAALGRLRRSCPNLHLEVIIDDGERLAARWQEGTLDVAVGACTGFVDEPIETWSVDLHWVCGIDEAPDPDQPLDVIVYAEPCSWRRLAFDALTAAGRDFRVSLTSHNVGATVAAVENGLGVALLTTECLRPDTMRVISIGDDGTAPLTAQFGLYAAHRLNDSGRAAVELLRESLRGWTAPAAPREAGLILA